MENNKFWIFLGLGVAVAFSLKWVSGGESTTIGKRWSLNANIGEEIQYKRVARSNDRVAGLSESRRSIPLPVVKSGTTAAAPAAAKKTEVAKAENKAKKNDKKKKRRKKRLNAIPAPAFPEDPASDDSDESEAIAFNGGGGGAPVAPVNQIAGGGAASPNNNKTQAEWEKSLLATPNARETSRFIGAYQTRQISKDVFYGVVGQMLTDGRTQMRQLGVNALGGTPSIESYQMLITTAESEQGTVKTQAERYLDDYANVQNLNILYIALTMPDMDSDVKIQALNDLRDIATKAITRKPSSNVEPEGEAIEIAAPSASDLRMFDWFQRFDSVLTTLAKSDSDEAVRTLAQQVQGPVIAAKNYFDPSKIAQQ